MGNNADNKYLFKIDDFAAEIHRTGVARPAFFYVLITPPPTVYFGSEQTDRAQYLPFRVQSVNMPGRSVNTFQRQINNFPPRSMPFGFTTLPVSIEVLLSDDMRERQFFMNWQDRMVGWSRTKPSETPGMFDIGYYDDGIGTIEILQFAETPMLQGREKPGGGFFAGLSDMAMALGFDPSVVMRDRSVISKINAATKITLHEAYPFTINDIGMKWSDPGVAVMTVEFKYVYFTEEHDQMAPGDAYKKSGFRTFMEGFNRFIPLASRIRNSGFKNLFSSELKQRVVGPTAGVKGMFSAVNPFH